MEGKAQDPSTLTTAQLAQRTGVPPGTLRMWELRHDFPQPARLAGGHRRYSERDVEAVLNVVSLREQGLSLAPAIASAVAASRTPPLSIFAGLAQRRPDLQPMMLAKPSMLALTRAIEDEYCAAAGAGVLVGSFQRARFYRQSERRWRELARTARLAVALADFKALRHRSGALVEVPIGRDDPLAREWAIVVRAPGTSACLAAWEIPEAHARADSDRRFEALWSPEGDLAVAAISVAAELIEPLAPSVAERLQATARDPIAPAAPEARAAARQAHRMLAYLAEAGRR